MKFSKEFLIDLLDAPDGYVTSHISGKSRWSVHYSGVFEHDGKFYETHWSEGATECQDEHAYEHAPEEIECREVVPQEKTVTVYVPIGS